MARNGYVPPPPTPIPTPTSTPSPSPSPSPTPKSGGTQLLLTVNESEPMLGKRLRFTLNSNLPSGDFVIIGSMTSGRSRSYIPTPWNITVPNFVSDFVTDRTLKIFKGKLQNSNVIQITPPSGASAKWLLGSTFRFVALVQGPEGTIISNPIALQFQPGGKKNGSKGGNLKSTKIKLKKSHKRGRAFTKAARKLIRQAIKANKILAEQ